MPGLLIVNADDLGADRVATDRTLACFESGCLSSATAMMFMDDSERAAQLAPAAGLPVGLHLNLTQRFDASGVPLEIARRQAAIVRFFSSERRRRFGFAPHLLAAVRRSIADQLECFRTLYGAEPTHIDGHNHIHLNPTVLACLPRGCATRPAHVDGRQGPTKLPQRARDRALSRRHLTVARFFPLTSIHPQLGGSGLEAALALADATTVEVMVHPAQDPDFEVLTSSEWTALLGGYRLGSYRDLRR